jgi:hypothetical protein
MTASKMNDDKSEDKAFMVDLWLISPREISIYFLARKEFLRNLSILKVKQIMHHKKL